MQLFHDLALAEKVLDVKSKRNKLIANNIANADVPGFKRSDIVFEELLQTHLKDKPLPMVITRSKHFPSGSKLPLEPTVYKQDDRSSRNDQNNVDIEKEMVEATKNAYSYNITVDQVARKFRMIQSAISEGRK